MNRTMIAAGTLLVGISLAATACGSGSNTAKSSAASATRSSVPAPTTSSMANANQPFGPACSTVPSTGPGSFNGMATDPVATAASHNPALSTLVTAVQKAGLLDTLNSAQAITVFAPDNAAFARLPKATLDKVLADKKELTSILTYHVVSGRHTPSDLAGGAFTTLQGTTVTTNGSNDSYTVNGAHVVCGNVQTANATVYIIDSVLTPKS